MSFEKWAISSSENAVSLAEESRILLSAGKKERAYYLSHMASEEASKSIILKYCKYLSITQSSMPKIKALLRNHKKKIDFVIKMAATDNPEIAKQIEDSKDELVTHINDLKNNSMYVTIIDNEIKTPKDMVSNINVENFVSYGEAISKYANTLNINRPKSLIESPLK